MNSDVVRKVREALAGADRSRDGSIENWLSLDDVADLLAAHDSLQEAILALVKAATSMQRLHGFVVGHSWPLEMMPEVMAAERELDRITASVGALNGS